MLQVAPALTDGLTAVVLVAALLALGSGENDLDLNFSGTWVHGAGPLSLRINLSTGCNKLSVSANKGSLTIEGQITSQCKRSDVLPLHLPSKEKSDFSLYWDPLLDQMKLEIGGKNLTLCRPVSLQGSCCTDLSLGPNAPDADYGIVNGSIKSDVITEKTRRAYTFLGQSISCSVLCEQALNRSNTDKTRGKARNEHLCAGTSEVEMKDDFKGYVVTSPIKGASAQSAAIVHLPPALKQAARQTSKVTLSFFSDNHLFQEGNNDVKVLNDVVEITVENEVIANLPEPIKITFHHEIITKMYSRKCVSWDARKDPLQVKWLEDGCETKQVGGNHTECQCNHLTYFTILVQLKPRPVRHLLALTAITSLGCAVSVISCFALIIYFCRKKQLKEQSRPIHLGLAVSLMFLNLLFFFTGVLANVAGESLCTWVAAGLHYALLSSFTWMGIQVFHTFWLVYRVFTPSPKTYIWMVVGFVLPAVPVIILTALGGIYGVKKVTPSDDVSNPYLMCWMTDTEQALLAHYLTNIPIMIVLVLSGGVMLFVIYREIKPRAEWSKNRVAFLSIWGLSCLFGTTWGLALLDFGPLPDFVLFVSCTLNSFQGFLLMLRFYMLNWMRKQAGRSGLGSTSSGSARQHMLQPQEKNEMN
ncbi:adhesion G-protein coupled receptor G5-like [Betta splendens]|uniref:Adhesion G-protein coupled receptor G5-like n=1 Tax=Betta splendens TaxID=158456 RepID=A0A6P7M000_BETSP|nr:adhesion G-protein coupled receptor G5-like [Betta splendens]